MKQMEDSLEIGNTMFRSRLFVGTGKYPNNKTMVEAIRASETAMVTVAVRRIDLDRTKEEGILFHLDPEEFFLLPNTAGCHNVKDALRLGCCAIGFTIYPGSEYQYDMIEEFKEISFEASQYGLPSVLWSYPRGGSISKEGETALDIISYAAHIAAQLGAHIIKVKPPSTNIENKDLKKLYEQNENDLSRLSNRIDHVKRCAFNYKRIVVFSGGNSKNTDDLLNEIKEIKSGGGNGSIIGRNTFQRPKKEAISLLKKIIEIYKN